MKGFFKQEKEVKVKKKASVKRNSGNKQQYTCESCGLYKTCLSPKMEPTGKGKKEILIIAEAPGETEDKKGIQLVGKVGQLLRGALSEIGVNLDRDFWKTNAVICRPPKNKTPSTLQINACRKYLFETIEKYKPKVIIPMGAIAVEALLGHRLTGRIGKVAISKWVGECIPDQEMKAWICPVYHPSFISRNEYDKTVYTVLYQLWKQHIENAIDHASKPIYIHNYESDVFVVTEESEAVSILNSLLKKKQPVAFDYETTGLKPHREGHRIVSVSVSDGVNSWGFPFFDSDVFRRKWKKLLLSKDILKIAHWSKFERMWTDQICGHDIDGELWDTAAIEHCIDNRKPIGLKFLSYTKFGVLGYDDSIDKYIRGRKKGDTDKSDNAFNIVDEAPLEGLLKYNAMDSLLTYKLWEEQKGKVSPHIKKGIVLFSEGLKYFTKAQQNGVRIHAKILQQKEERLDKRLIKIEKQILDSEELKKWDKEKPFNINSNPQLKHLLFNILKISSYKTTAKGNASTDKEALESIDLPIVKDILEYRRWHKAKNTYIGQFKREMVRGILHPFFNLDTVRTYRSSSGSPNFQNVPKRDDRVKNMIRELIIPRQGQRLVEWDYKQIEVIMASVYTKDPVLVGYVSDPTKDMHRDMAAKLFIRKKEEVPKKERYLGKNGFVFPEFYGSYWKQVAPGLWENMEQSTMDHLYDKGITDYTDFEDHVKKIERWFWEDQFSVYAEWKEKTIRTYEKKGYVDLYTGFRCYGPLKRNEIINYRFQGSAFHCLLWTFINVYKEMEKRNIVRSKIIGQIHDAIVGDIHPEDMDVMDSLVLDYGTKKIREYWDWIIVPLRIEKEQSAIDGNWSQMEDCGVLGE